MPRVDEGLMGRLEALAERAAGLSGLEVAEVELKGSGSKRVLRVFVDKADGVSIEDCEVVSRQLSQLLDETDAIPGEHGYTLEVSSPGVERKLSKPKDFDRFTGQKVKLVLKEPVEGSKVWIGVLVAFNGTELTVESGKSRVLIGFDQISKANLKYDW
jgi:ribosome maturation factor RimP